MKVRRLRVALSSALLLGAAGCGSSSTSGSGAAGTTVASSASSTAAATTVAAAAGATTAAATGGAAGKGITLAINPWTGSAVNANVAKVVLESKVNTPVKLVEIDEKSAWPGLDSDEIDANLEIWPSGHVSDKETYIDGKKTVVDLGLLGPKAKIGWYVPSFVTDADPSLKTWEGFKDPTKTKQFATAESGDLGQFLMGDPSYVSYDKAIIDNLKLPLKFIVAGSEAAEITAIKQAIADKKPVLLQFWQPHWLQSKVKLTEIKLPDVSAACTASAATDPPDGKYACDYPIDNLYKVASAKLEAKNAAAFAFLKKFQLTTDQQNEIAAMVDSDGMKADEAAKAWVDAHPDVVKAWLG